jgi:flagellar motility protein MotE (MotC chaperone)
VKNVRLLPVVIFAALALLVFKSVGLMTQGGYVLTGVSFAQAAGGGGDHGGGASGGETAADGGPTMTDTSPTMEDSAPTLPAAKDAAAGGHGAAPAEGEAAPAEGTPAADQPAEAAPAGAEHAAVADAAVADACAPVAAEGAASAGHGGDAAAAPPAKPGDVTGLVPVDCVPKEDAVPMMVDKATGQMVPVSEAAGADHSEKAVLESLSARRTELDTRETELAMRLALIEAAEKRVAERQAALETLQTQVAALVDEKKAAEEEQFKGLVSMYETMKPKEAALIFNELDPKVLLRVAKAMNPRKMAPIMAKMLPEKAQRLTVGLAEDDVPPEPTATAADMQALPQIVGQ